MQNKPGGASPMVMYGRLALVARQKVAPEDVGWPGWAGWMAEMDRLGWVDGREGQAGLGGQHYGQASLGRGCW